MAYLGNDLQVAFPTYRNIDDISGSFNGVTTSFPLTVAGVAPIPAPINSQQCLISVNGVVQRPDDSGAEGFRLSGGNIIFASAPAGGVDFFGVILAGADYVNIGANFPSGTAVAPSITFDSDLDTGIYNPAGNQIGFTTSGVQRLVINSSGQISGGLGTAAAPVISFISDPNTGIYSPGADQVAISTGGSGRLFVDASGRVGVGSAPSVGNGIHATINTNNYGTALVLQNANVNGWAAEMQFLGITTADTQAKIGALATGPGSNSGALAFYTANAGSYLERLRITSAGLVGVGTSSPGYLLDVVSSGASDIRVKSGGAGSAYLRLGTATRDHTIYSDASTGSLVAYDITSAATRLVIDSSGRVGIGTSSPGTALDVNGAIRSNDIFTLFKNGSDALYIGAGTIITGGASTDVAFRSNQNGSILFSTNGATERMRLDASGRLGIGTTSPGASLDVNGSALLSNSSYLGFGNADALIQGSSASGANFLMFRTNLNERARIDHAGRLLVGTSTSVENVAGNLQVNGGSAVINTFIANSAAYRLSFVKSRSATFNGKAIVQSGDDLGRISFNGDDGVDYSSEAASIACQVDGTPGSDDMPGRLVFSTTADGASSPTERMRIGNGGLTSIGGVYTFTTGNAANVNVDSSGYLQRSTSSIKYKTDVETLDDQYADALLACRPVWYRSTCKHDCSEHSYWGFIAEEVASIDPRLVHWKTTEITHDENGAAVSTPCTPEPEGVQYERFVPHLLNLIKRQKEQIEAMEARLTALESA